MQSTAVAVRRRRVLEWLARYAPAEAAATVGALAAAALTGPAGPAVTAYAGAIGDGVGFYLVLFVRDLRRQPPAGRRRAVVRTVRDLVMEFGPAELLDTFLVRPLAMYLAQRWLGSATAGVVVGKVVADAVFYALAITAYELRKRSDRRVASALGGGTGSTGAAPGGRGPTRVTR
jgi:hypothetical protein